VENQPTSKILVFAPEITPRVAYSFGFIFQTILGAELTFTSNPKEFKQSTLPRINYSSTNFSSGLFLNAHPLLFEKNIADQEIKTLEFRQINVFFPSSADSFLPFDPFAFSFYSISRYEEYLNENTDTYGRFNDSENILVKLDLHQKPIVDVIAYWIAEELRGKFPEFRIRQRSFQFVTTIDIDNAWAFRNKSLLISIGGMAKAIINGRLKEVQQRFAVALRLADDPYDTYKYILQTYKGQLNRIPFFFLLADRNEFDKSLSYTNKSFRQLITSLADVCDVGIHPSYSSSEKPWLFDTEKKRLENIINKPVVRSRQHFLKLKFPQTYQTAIKSGITDDYTMGFARLAGFRAGTCTPFHFFDLKHNRQTELLIHPFQVMDVTLKNYLDLQPQQAWQLIEKLMLEIKQVNGTFVSLWHNESLSDSGQWQGWPDVFQQILEKGLILENE
jgi:hypothetical protein